MGVRHLLVHVDSSPGAERRLGLATALAKRFGARLTGLFAEADSLGASIVGRRSQEHMREAAVRARELFTGTANVAGVDGEWWSAGFAGHGELIDLTAACCRHADLVIFGQPDAEHGRVPADFLEQVLLDCGRPMLVVPAVGTHADVGRRVVIGWNASRESARAVGDALPLIQDGAFVGILAFQQAAPKESATPIPAADIVAHLALHGIQARYHSAVREEAGIGVAGALINYGFDSQADLTVVGAPGHGFPLRHVGPAVREMLRSMATPLLLAH